MSNCQIYIRNSHCPGPLMRCVVTGRLLTLQKWVWTKEEDGSLFRPSNHLPLSLRVQILSLPFPAVCSLAYIASCNSVSPSVKWANSVVVSGSSLQLKLNPLENLKWWCMWQISERFRTWSALKKHYCYLSYQVMVLALPKPVKWEHCRLVLV